MDKKEYIIIKTQNDIDKFMEKMCGFHDCVIKEIKYVSGSNMTSNRLMQPVNILRRASFIILSQRADFPIIEMCFDKIRKLSLVPRNEHYDSIILGASLCLIDDFFYWSEWTQFKLEDTTKFDKTWVSSEKVYWRLLKWEDINP